MPKKMKSACIGNGISFNTIVDPKFKTNRISVHFIMPLRQETAAENALIPFLLRMGCQAYPDLTALNRRLNELYGAALGADVQKLGDNQLMSLSISSIDNHFALDHEDVVGELSRLLADLILHPVMESDWFAEKIFALEKQYLLDTIQSEMNDKRSYAITRLEEQMCQSEPYGVNRYGSLEHAKALERAKVTEAYHTMLRTARIELIFVGCGSPQSAESVFRTAFADLERDAVHQVETQIVNSVSDVREFSDQLPVSQSKMVLGFRTGVSPEDPSLSAFRLMTALYGGSPVSKLFLNVREKLSLCYYCVARFNRGKGILLVDCGVEDENIGKARDEILRQLDAVKNGDFSDEELEHARLSLMNSFKTIGETPGGLEGWYLGQRCFGEAHSPEEDAERLASVTRQQIIDAAGQVKLDAVYLLTSGKKGGEH